MHTRIMFKTSRCNDPQILRCYIIMKHAFLSLLPRLIKSSQSVLGYIEYSKMWRNMVKSVFAYNAKSGERRVSSEPVKFSF